MSFCSFSLVLNVAAFTFLAYREVTQRKRLRAKIKETAKKYQILMDGVQSDINETIKRLKAQRDELYNEMQKREAMAQAAELIKEVKPKRAYKKKEAKDGDNKKQK